MDHVSFSIEPGEILGYLGPNGAGKSTTVKMLTGLIEPSSGSIRFHGREVRQGLKAYQHQIGYVPASRKIGDGHPRSADSETLEKVCGLTGRAPA